MVKLRTAITSVTQVALTFDILSLGRGKGTLVTSSDVTTPFRATPFRLPDVTSTDYTTIFQVNYRLEDVGFLEIRDITLDLNQDVIGNGQFRWQISGDGGTTFNTMIESLVFNVTAWTSKDSFRAGTWITQADAGDNKFQIRMQAKVVAGIVNNRIFDSSTVSIRYRKKVLT